MQVTIDLLRIHWIPRAGERVTIRNAKSTYYRMTGTLRTPGSRCGGWWIQMDAPAGIGPVYFPWGYAPCQF